jgi:hypothetical protein
VAHTWKLKFYKGTHSQKFHTDKMPIWISTSTTVYQCEIHHKIQQASTSWYRLAPYTKGHSTHVYSKVFMVMAHHKGNLIWIGFWLISNHWLASHNIPCCSGHCRCSLNRKTYWCIIGRSCTLPKGVRSTCHALLTVPLMNVENLAD